MSASLRVPSYRQHKQSGQAIVTLPDGVGGRHDVLLGKYGTPESRQEYARVLGEWEANGRRLPRRHGSTEHLSINELILAYYRHAEQYYRHPDGRPTSEVDAIRLALRWLKNLYGHTAAAEFDSLALEAMRDQMIREGLCRNRINKDVSRVKRLFRWASSRHLVSASVYQLLETVNGLRAGRSAAKETQPVRPVAEAVVEATLPFLRPQVAAMVRLELLTGMRPGEVVIMRGMDLETTGKVWRYRPGSDQGTHGAHKAAYRGQNRIILIGPKGQEVLRPWLRLNVSEYLFQPREVMEAFRAEQRANRRSKVPPSQQNRRKREPRRSPGSRYTVSGFACTVAKAARKARGKHAVSLYHQEALTIRQAYRRACQELPHWHPNQLRHAKATELRREGGIDAARVVLGHRSPQVTEVYAELDVTKAAEVMERLG